MIQFGEAASGSLRSILATFRREAAAAAGFSLFVNLLMLAPTLYMLQLFDRVLLSRNEFTLMALTLILALLVAVTAMAEWLRSRLLVEAGIRFDTCLGARVFEAAFDSKLKMVPDNETQAFGDLTTLRQFLTGGAVFALFDAPWTPVFIAVLFVMHPLLGWFGVGFLVLLTLLAWGSHRFTAPAHESAGAAALRSSAYLNAKVRNAETVQAMGMLPHMRRRWLRLHEAQLSSHRVAQRRAHRATAVTKFVQYSQQSIVLAAGAWLAIHGEISAGAMVAANALMANALRPIGSLVGTWKQFGDARHAYRRLAILLGENPQRSGTHGDERVQGRIELRGLVATAATRFEPILKGLDAQFLPGEVVAIVGPSGAGKSTLARCIAGAWPDCDGEVLLDGKPMPQWSRAELGPHVGFLPQHIELLDGTLAENIARFGSVESAKVIEAAQRAGIHEMILRLPMGYDTPMEIARDHLSGGQRQRVALARALHGSPALIVLDEPTSNLDDIGITALATAIRTLKGSGSTIFMVVHQQNLLALADRVLQLGDGVIARLVQLPQTRTSFA